MHSSHAVRQVMGSYPSIFPFIEKYKLGVHQFASAPDSTVLEGLSQHLPIPLPPTLKQFFSKWNGAILFNGALIIRSVAEFAPVSAQHIHLVCFADEQHMQRQWCYAKDGTQFIIGSWKDDVFTPLYQRFEDWLLAACALLDAHVQQPSDEQTFRLKLHPDNPYLKLPMVDEHLQFGQIEAACRLSSVLVDQVKWPSMFFLHGSLLFALGADTARQYYILGLKELQLPAEHPALLPDLDSLYPLFRLLSQDSQEIVELIQHCCFETLSELNRDVDVAILDALMTSLIQHYMAQGQRIVAIDLLSSYLKLRPAHLNTASLAGLRYRLALVRFEHGQHDASEKELRSLLHSEGAYFWEAELLVGRIASLRHERWNIEILKNVADHAPSDELQLHAWIYIGHSYVRRQHSKEAKTVFEYCLSQSALFEQPSLKASVQLGLAMASYQLADITAANQVPEADLLHPIDQIARLLFRSKLNPNEAHTLLTEALQIARDQELNYEETKVLVQLIPYATSVAQTAVDHAKSTLDPMSFMLASQQLSKPCAQVEWHIDTVQHYMRMRTRAQRVQYPLQRKDADHPERRIHQHRLAIAKSPKSGVDALARELLLIEKDLQEGVVLPSNPKLYRYMAAVDLLCFHPSLHAADSMLRMLVDERATGLVRQSLVQAVSRSRNMALVEGLIETLRTDESGRHLLAIIEILGWRRENAAVTSLRQRLDASYSVTARRAALMALGRIGHESALEDVAECLDEPELLEVAALSLLLLGDWRGIDAMAQALHERPESTPYTYGELVGRYGGRNYFILLSQVARQDSSAAIGAILGLGYIGDMRAIPILLDQCTHRDPKRTQAASQALEVLTGHFEQSSDIMLRTRWEEWLMKNEGRLQRLGLMRNGQTYSLEFLVEQLGHDSPVVRLNCYDELVVASGAQLPFDGRGPWRTQVAQRKAWSIWLKKQDFKKGQKYFKGEPLL
ncbi:MAG: hypothetical protein ACON4U_05750 [Myxococcota bacterium]